MKHDLDRLNRFTNYERFPYVLKPVFSLDGFKKLLRALGDPQKKFRSVHIVGTVGKGSVCALTESSLRAAGHRTGLYTSPNLWDIRERIRIDGEMIAPKQLSKHVDAIVEALNGDYSAATYFEAFTAAAFLEFARAGVDIAIVEAGLGGRLDATNVVPSFIAVIARLGLDHKAVLGPTLRHIAAEKAGAIKRGGVAVTIRQSPAVMPTLRDAAAAKNAKLVEIQPGEWCRSATDAGGTGLRVLAPERVDGIVRMPLAGAFQRENAALSLGVIDLLRKRGFKIPGEAIQRGFESVEWPCRLDRRERLGRVWILDGAHNPPAARVLARELDDYALVFGVMRDKDMRGTLRPLAARAKIIVAAGMRSDRSAPPAEIVAAARGLGFAAHPAHDMASALKLAKKLAPPDMPILVTGSLYAVAEAAEILG